MSIVSKVVCAALLALGVPASAQQPDRAATEQAQTAREAQERAEREAMQREVEEAARAIGAYSVGRREQAQARAREALDALDVRIRRMSQEMSQEAQRQHAEAQGVRERQRAEAEARRKQAAERYRDMEGSNAKSWAKARDRFIQAYREVAARLGAEASPSDKQKEAPAQHTDEPDRSKDE